jgi:hypothetical protein
MNRLLTVLGLVVIASTFACGDGEQDGGGDVGGGNEGASYIQVGTFEQPRHEDVRRPGVVQPGSDLAHSDGGAASDGSVPTTDAGTPPTSDAGTPPTSDAGTPPTSDAGTPPTSDAGTQGPTCPEGSNTTTVLTTDCHGEHDVH